MLKEKNQKPKYQCASSLMSPNSPKLRFHKNHIFENELKKTGVLSLGSIVLLLSMAGLLLSACNFTKSNGEKKCMHQQKKQKHTEFLS